MPKGIAETRQAIASLFGWVVPDTALRKIRSYSRKLWVRVVGMGVLAFLVVGATQVLEAFVPVEMAKSVNGASADRLLQIIATAMLAVTTFSLTVMVSVYRSSSSQWTPRVHRLIQEDKITQNTLAAFIGAYVYALVAIVLREVGVFGDDRAMVLFWVTVAVLVFIVFNVVRWTLHLQSLGSLITTTRQVEEITQDQFEERMHMPCMGAVPWTDDLPATAQIITADESGYVAGIYPERLNDAAEAQGATLYLLRSIGQFVFEGEPLFGVIWHDDGDMDALRKAVISDVLISDIRNYDQDPRFGLQVMGEIASKALSAGINDPGTAIDVITRVGRILSLYRNEIDAGGGQADFPRLRIRPLDLGELLDDGFGALARDGAALVEVQIGLQMVLSSLMNHSDPGLRAAAQDLSAQSYARAAEAMTFAPDVDRLTEKMPAPVLKDVRG